MSNYIIVCVDCGEEVTHLSNGDEGWTYCENCCTVEPDTEEILESEE